MRTGRYFLIAVLIALVALVIFVVGIFFLLLTPMAGGDLPEGNATQLQTSVSQNTTPGLTQTALAHIPSTFAPHPTADIVSATEEPTATSGMQVASVNTDIPITIQTSIPTLSTEQYSTAVANLATAQTSPTAVPMVSNPENDTIAGNGDVRSYYNTELAYPNTMRVTLELVFRQLAIAPTPLEQFVNIDVNTDIIDPILMVDDVQETPAPARTNDRVSNIPLFVVVELECLETSFIGCEQKQFTHLNLSGINSWNWTIQAIEGISGNQDLSFLVYEADESGNIVNTRPIYEHSFTISVSDNFWMNLLENNLGTMILAISIFILGGIGYFGFGRKGSKIKPLGVSAFISYKRRGSWGIAEKVHDRLTSRGVDTFIDSQDLHEGDFETRLTTEIRNRNYLVVVLVVETLQSEWVVKEIAYAFELGKTVIPVLIEGLKMEDLAIPDEIADLKKQNAVSLYQKYFDAAIDEILVFLKPIE